MDLVRKKHLNTMEGSQFYISLKITVKNYFCTNMVYKMIFFFQMTYYITIRSISGMRPSHVLESPVVPWQWWGEAGLHHQRQLHCHVEKVKYLIKMKNTYRGMSNWTISYSFGTMYSMYWPACCLSPPFNQLSITVNWIKDPTWQTCCKSWIY